VTAISGYRRPDVEIVRCGLCWQPLSGTVRIDVDHEVEVFLSRCPCEDGYEAEAGFAAPDYDEDGTLEAAS